MVHEQPSQLVISHGGAAGPEPRVSTDAPSDIMTAVMPAAKALVMAMHGVQLQPRPLQ